MNVKFVAAESGICSFSRSYPVSVPSVRLTTIVGREVAMERKVNVWGKVLAISVSQQSKRVWTAQGDYMGERIEAQGATAPSAVALWEKAARCKSTESPKTSS